jgi:hypothetical protein
MANILTTTEFTTHMLNMLTAGTQSMVNTDLEVISILTIYLGGCNCGRICE